MAKPSRIRRIALIVVAAPFALLLVAIIVAASLFLTFTDRWGKPTDFAVQYEALTRSHLGMASGPAPSEQQRTREWLAIRDDITKIHEARIPGFMTPDGPQWPWSIFTESPSAEDVALRTQLLQDLEDRQIFQRLDAFSTDPRILSELPENPLLADTLPSLAPLRQLTHFLSWRMKDAVQRDDLDAALADLSRIDTIARVLSSTPSILHYLYSAGTLYELFESTIRIAQAPGVTTDQCARLAALIESTRVSSLDYALKGDRLIALDSIRANLSPSAFVPIDARSQMHKTDELFADAQRRIARTIQERRADTNTVDPRDRWSAIDKRRFLIAGIHQPAVTGPLLSKDKAELDRLGTILSIAIVRYRLDHAGELPPTLDALVPHYLAELPIDPFSGAPPIYLKGPVQVPQYGSAREDDPQQAAAPFMLYSVGLDGVDNAARVNFYPSDGLKAQWAGHDYILYPRAD